MIFVFNFNRIETISTFKTRMCQAELAASLHQEFFKNDFKHHFEASLMLDTNRMVLLVIDHAAAMLETSQDATGTLKHLVTDVISNMCKWMKEHFKLNLPRYDKGKLPGHLKVCQKGLITLLLKMLVM